MSRQGEFGYGALGGNRNQFRDDGGNEFSSVVKQVSDGIFKINNSVSQLEKAVRQIGTPEDSMTVRDRIQNTLQSTKSIVTITTRNLSQLKQLAYTATRPERLQCERLTNDLQETVKRYGEVQKKVMAKMKSCPTVPKPHIPEDYSNEHSSLIADNQRQEQFSQLQQHEAVIDFDNALIEDREERIRQIEGAMLDVNEIFRDLSAMVSEQGEMIDSIEANVDRADTNIESGNEQLVTASRYQKKARKKMCCIFVILIVVFGILGLILYITLHNN
ncbi:syntaxin-12-like isoform X2 [Anneissia japonica]|uniref:syntaxin-12-like isoform X2 n=1 Tax=Anneissia japonica TaxID=1529436 RepID=UPI0014259CB0|nr:syntaxin-12-like isoform X2 [Anneissia japonica]